ncbi:MAG: hypothetical protein ACRDVG_01185 [Jatrophihabitantaceae bacterium]
MTVRTELLAGRRPLRPGAAWLLSSSGLLAAALIAAFARWGPDWPAQEFRAWTAHHDGLLVWTDRWYSGEPLPGYSVLYPVISSGLGAGLTGFLSVVGATVAATRFMPAGGRVRRLGYLASVAIVLAADLLIGQVPYLLGVAFGAWALVALVRQRPVVAVLLAAAASLSSPLAGAFLLLAIPPLAVLYSWRRTTAFLGAGAGIAVSAVLGGAGGPFPYVPRVFVWTELFAVLAILLAARRDRAMTVLGLSYGAVSLVAFLVPNPIGGNLARYGQLIALPLIWHVAPRLWRSGRSLVALLVASAMLWSTYPALSSVVHGSADPSSSASYYSGIRAFLRTQNPLAGRLEVVFTREHWEAYYLARDFPLGRGWERQSDLQLNAVLYGQLTPAKYLKWLQDNAIGLVALPDVSIDYGGDAESQLLRNVPRYLVPAWHDRHWRVWAVRAPHSVVVGPASIRSISTASFSLDFHRAGAAIVRIRSSPMWTVNGGEGCVSATPDGWLRVASPVAGPITVHATLDMGAITTADARCS